MVRSCRWQKIFIRFCVRSGIAVSLNILNVSFLSHYFDMHIFYRNVKPLRVPDFQTLFCLMFINRRMSKMSV